MIQLLVDSRTVGGIERHVATLAQALAQSGIACEVLLLADYGDNPWCTQLRAACVPFRALDGTIGGLLHVIRHTRPALLHTHGYRANVLGRLVARLTGTPVVATFHAGERAPFPVSAYQLLDEWTSILGGRIAVSEAIQRSIPYRSTFIGNFMLMPPAPGAGPLPRRIGFVGRLSHEKGPDRFCEMARRCGAIAEWHMWGDGPMRQALEQQYADVVTFHGLVTDLAPVWASLGLLVMPSRAEGLPMAALEALASGVPIAATAVGGLPTVVVPGETGWLFDPANLDEASETLMAWDDLDHARQQQYRSACRALVSARFSPASQLPKILDVYRAAGWRDTGSR
jgi:glycosyltransferase involved in cell wall biosynthesis